MSENLKTDYGMLAFSADAGSRANISPFVSGFHLEVSCDDVLYEKQHTHPPLQALLTSDIRNEDVIYILEKTFGTMADPLGENYTGAFFPSLTRAYCSQSCYRNFLGGHVSRRNPRP